MVLAFEYLDMKSSSVAIQMKANEEYCPVILFIVMYKVILSLEAGNLWIKAKSETIK